VSETLPAVAEATPDPKVAVKVEQRVAEYIKVRDAIKAANDQHELSIKPLVELQNMLTGWLQTFIETAGAESVKTANGTVYTTTRYSASLADPEAFMRHVIGTQDFDLLDRKANVTACKDFVKENGTLPPGVNMSAVKTVGVRRPSAK